MASAKGSIVDQLQILTECSICFTTFTDPRILPCQHTFCLKCLEETASSPNKRPGDEMPCPTCRTVFTVPSNGIAGLMRDFKMISLITVANEAHLKLIVTDFCDRHIKKPLDAYCLECENPVCFSCLIDNHRGHKATDIVKVRERFPKELAKYMKRISSYKQQCVHMMKELDDKKKRYFKEVFENETAILKRSKELVDRIERNTKSLLEELYSLKTLHVTEMEKEREELENQCAIMENYQTYYEATMAKASLVDICHVKEELPIMTEKLDKWFKTNTGSSFEVLLQLQDKIEVDLKSESNIVGKIKSTTKDESVKEKKVIVVSSGDNHWSVTNDMYEFNISRPNEISKLQPEMRSGKVAVSLDDKLFVIGIGEDYNEIWKFDRISGWKKCADLDEGRERHCANVVDTLIFICGGLVPFHYKFLKSVEAYDLQKNKCSIVGELVDAVEFAATVAYKGFIYIFGGRLEYATRATDRVQRYSTANNTCSVFSKPMPSPMGDLRALTWNNSVILLNKETCFIFDFQEKIWRERKRFKTGLNQHFGLVHDDEKVYVFGGGTDEIKCVLLDDIINDKDVEWKLHGRLPKPTGIYAYA